MIESSRDIFQRGSPLAFKALERGLGGITPEVRENVYNSLKRVRMTKWLRTRMREKHLNDPFISIYAKRFIEKYRGAEVHIYKRKGEWYILGDDNYQISTECFEEIN